MVATGMRRMWRAMRHPVQDIVCFTVLVAARRNCMLWLPVREMPRSCLDGLLYESVNDSVRAITVMHWPGVWNL